MALYAVYFGDLSNFYVFWLLLSFYIVACFFLFSNNQPSSSTLFTLALINFHHEGSICWKYKRMKFEHTEKDWKRLKVADYLVSTLSKCGLYFRWFFWAMAYSARSLMDWVINRLIVYLINVMLSHVDYLYMAVFLESYEF